MVPLSGFCFLLQPLQLSRGSRLQQSAVLQPQAAASKTHSWVQREAARTKDTCSLSKPPVFQGLARSLPNFLGSHLAYFCRTKAD